MIDIQSATAEIRRGKKKNMKERTNNGMKIYMACPITYRADIKNAVRLIVCGALTAAKTDHAHWRL